MERELDFYCFHIVLFFFSCCGSSGLVGCRSILSRVCVPLAELRVCPVLKGQLQHPPPPTSSSYFLFRFIKIKK